MLSFTGLGIGILHFVCHLVVASPSSEQTDIQGTTSIWSKRQNDKSTALPDVFTVNATEIIGAPNVSFEFTHYHNATCYKTPWPDYTFANGTTATVTYKDMLDDITGAFASDATLARSTFNRRLLVAGRGLLRASANLLGDMNITDDASKQPDIPASLPKNSPRYHDELRRKILMDTSENQPDVQDTAPAPEQYEGNAVQRPRPVAASALGPVRLAIRTVGVLGVLALTFGSIRGSLSVKDKNAGAFLAALPFIIGLVGLYLVNRASEARANVLQDEIAVLEVLRQAAENARRGAKSVPRSVRRGVTTTYRSVQENVNLITRGVEYESGNGAAEQSLPQGYRRSAELTEIVTEQPECAGPSNSNAP